MSSQGSGEVVALVAARGGSRGIPGKNLTPLCERPLIAWTIDQAARAAGVSSVWVTSDSEEILAASRFWGAQTILRPAALATDEASSEAAWAHALDEIERRQGQPELAVALQATSPLREPADIERGIDALRSQGLDSLFSASPLEAFVWEREAGGALRSVTYDHRRRQRRQDAPAHYVENGSFYVFRPRSLRAEGNRLAGRIGLVEMEPWKSFQIDAPGDLEPCEALMRHYLLGERVT